MTAIRESIEGTVAFRGHATWYRVTGPLGAGRPPVIAMHGGPGSTHDYLQTLEQLADDGWPVVLYDQLGNGRSTHLPDEGADFWTVELFLAELDALLEHLGVTDDYVLFGQSWGGMLAAEHAVRQPAGLRGVVIADSPSSMPVWRAESLRLRGELSPEHQDALARHESAGTFDDREYERASMAYYGKFVCRMEQPPVEVLTTLQALHDDPTVYGTMNGPNDFHVIGTLADWSIDDRLHLIEAPTLVITGRYDEATPATAAPYYQLVPDAEWEIIEDASHMPHVEAPEAFFAVLRRYLDSLI